MFGVGRGSTGGLPAVDFFCWPFRGFAGLGGFFGGMMTRRSGSDSEEDSDDGGVARVKGDGLVLVLGGCW